MKRRAFRVDPATVYAIVEDLDEIRWALYGDDDLLALLESESECRAVAEALNAMPAPGEQEVP